MCIRDRCSQRGANLLEQGGSESAYGEEREEGENSRPEQDPSPKRCLSGQAGRWFAGGDRWSCVTGHCETGSCFPGDIDSRSLPCVEFSSAGFSGKLLRVSGFGVVALAEAVCGNSAVNSLTGCCLQWLSVPAGPDRAERDSRCDRQRRHDRQTGHRRFCCQFAHFVRQPGKPWRVSAEIPWHSAFRADVQQQCSRIGSGVFCRLTGPVSAA
jgi:hypothetical protein